MLAPHNINLIDTPGHADFTFEVLRSLRILDGAVCILDGVAGVEAQTEKVWYQAAKYSIPKILYVNKLDRDGASFAGTVRQIASRLHVWPAVCQVPWWKGGKGQFIGLGDAIGLRALRWPDSGDGKSFEVLTLDQISNSENKFAQEIRLARKALIELLSEHDDHIVEKYLEADEDHLKISGEDITASIRRCVLNPQSNIVPIFAGASFRNMGVQPLLDAIVNLLPEPSEAPDPKISIGSRELTLGGLMSGQSLSDETQARPHKFVAKPTKQSTALIRNLEACALAFKVVNDARRGALVYVRVYSGSITRQSLLYNTNLQISERAPQLLKMYASDAVQIDNIPAGQIGVIPGLRHTRTGDTLISYSGSNAKSGPPAPSNSLQLRPIEVPPAVFFSSVEPHSLGEEKAVRSALDILVREDPSLQVSEDEESGQTLLSGMGEFHLEIARDRLINDFKAKADLGKIEIAYREAILQPSQPDIYAFDREQGGKHDRAACIASVEPLQENSTPSELDETFSSFHEDGNRITITIDSPPSPSPEPGAEPWDGTIPPHLTRPIIYSALKNGALAALSRGINFAFPLHASHVHISLDPRKHLYGTDSTPAALSAAARLATKQALKSTALEHGSAIMELVMSVTVTTDEASLGAVVNDISASRGGHILSLDDAAQTSGPTVNSTIKDLPHIDLSRVYVPPDPFGPSNSHEQGVAVDSSRQRNVVARVPLKEMVGYLKHLRSLTGGRGTFVMSADGWERLVGQREKVLLKEIRGIEHGSTRKWNNGR
ncbi:Ribosome-releasing factor 2, mitochondrial [Puttea exsequens]|nr:Ribosome-releasing factor 2, mitochondrial [Puttea exsequens]